MVSPDTDPSSPLASPLGLVLVRLLERRLNLLLALGLTLLGLVHRLADLAAMVNVDMYFLWSKRIRGFIEGLFSGELAATFQSHHPGVLLMWIDGLLWKLFGVVQSPVDPTKLWLSTLPIALVGIVFGPTTFLLLTRLFGSRHRLTAFLTGALIATEPMLVAHSRNAHLDLLVTSLSFCAVLTALIAFTSSDRRYTVASGVLFGLGVLTKASAGGLAMGVVLVALASTPWFRPQRFRRFLTCVGIGVIAAGVVVLLWPALWVDPFRVIQGLTEGVAKEVDKASAFMFLGEVGKLELPLAVYPCFALFLLTPELLLPLLFLGGLLAMAPPRLRRGVGAVLLVSLPFLLLIATSARIGMRYMLPFVPFIALGSAAVFETGWGWVRRRGLGRAGWLLLGLVLAAAVGGRLVRLERLHPHPITYCSTWTGVDCTQIFHLGWGEGIREAAWALKDHLPHATANKPVRIYGGGYARTIGAWLPVHSAKEPKDAEILLDYLPDWQRRTASHRSITAFVQQTGAPLLFETKLNGRVYVRAYPGGRYQAVKAP